MTEEHQEAFETPYDANTALETDVNLGEPHIAQLDAVGDYRISKYLYSWGKVRNKETGELEWVPIEVVYKDLEIAAGEMLSHLNMLMKFVFSERTYMIISAKIERLKVLKYKYRRDPIATQLIISMWRIYKRNIMESGGGSHQHYIASLVGSWRKVEVNTPMVEEVS